MIATNARRARPPHDRVSPLRLVLGLVFVALGAFLFLWRDRLGEAAKTHGHGVTPLAYGVVGAILFAFGALYALGGAE
jgi:hypothetical protein